MANLGLRPARLVLQSDRRLVREALAAYFANGRGFTVVGHTDSAHGLHTLCALGRPDVCLIDVETLNPRIVRMLRDIRTSFPGIDLVVTYTSLSLELLAEAVRAGVTSFVPSSRGLDAVLRLLRQRVRRARVNLPTPPDGHALTDRELGVISLMSSGHTVSDIARLLRISPHTVDNHKRRVYAKFGVDSQSLAVSRAVSLALLESNGNGHGNGNGNGNGRAQHSQPGQPPLAVVCGPPSLVLDQVMQALVARGLPFVHARTRQPLHQDHWARWHRGPVITVLVDPAGQDWLLPASLHTSVVVVQSVPPDLSTVVESLATGARAVLHAKDVAGDLAEVLALVARGYVAVSAEHAAELAGWIAVRHAERGARVPDLTAREQDILGLLARGHTIRQAARELGIAAKTVENTQARLYRKLGTRNRAETLTVAYRLGLLDATGAPV
jgi:DNA-binding NarL/FixJ family response regulator